MALFHPSNCNMVSLKENFRKHWMMQGASRTFSVLPGRWDLMISILHYLHCVFTFLCRSKALCLFQNSLRTWIRNTVFLFWCSHLQFLFDLRPRYSICTFILIMFLWYLAFFNSIYFSLSFDLFCMLPHLALTFTFPPVHPSTSSL